MLFVTILFDIRVVFVIRVCFVLVYRFCFSVDIAVVFACVFAVFPSEGE